MQKFLVRFFQRALAVRRSGSGALLVWFVGPLVSFLDTPRPLASVGSRVVTIALLLMLVLWLVNWSMSIIGISVLCPGDCLVTPLLAPGDVHIRLHRCGSA